MENFKSYILTLTGFFITTIAFSQEETNYYKSQDPVLRENNSTVIFRENERVPENIIILPMPPQLESAKKPTIRIVTDNKPINQQSPNGSESTPNANTTQSSASSTASTTNKTVKGPVKEVVAEEDPSVLEHNFLYILIKNFKITEIVD